MSKLFRAALMTGFALVGVVAVAGCGDSSTATAPLTQDVTTRQMSSDDASSSSAAAEASSQAAEAASKATSTLPATKPDSSTKVPGNFPGGSGASQLTDKERAYLAALKQQKVAFMGDDDGSVSLSMGHYVCDAQAKKVDPMLIKVTVRAGIGPMTENENEASAKADKLIATADKQLC